MSHIEIHIDALVLYGFAPADRWRIGQAIEHELTRLFAEQGLPSTLSMGGELARIDGGAFHVAAGTTVEGLGAQVAQAVYGGLQRGYEV
jgi:hypothetical protein